MQQDFPSTSQELIHALKAREDPPNGHALSKIQMASHAWSQSAPYFPNKGQVIVDWILTRFLKEKDKPSPSNPVLDVDHWQLLSSVICSGDVEGSRRVKAWLTPLLNRTPLAPIFIAFLDRVPHLPPEAQAAVFTPFTLCFSVLWSVAKHKINVETLLECFSATLKTARLDVGQQLEEARAAVCSGVAETYHSALTRSSNRKKLSSTFLSSHLELWLRCVPTLDRSGLNEIYSVGAETLFGPETLRQLIDDPCSNPVIQALSRIDPTTVLPSLPALLESFYEFTTRNRGHLFPRPQPATHTITDGVRESTMGFYDACDGLICASRVAASGMLDARLRLLSIVEEKNVFSGDQRQLKQILSEKCRLTVDELCSHATDTAEAILNLICRFSRIDFDLVSPHLSFVLPVVAKLSFSSKAAAGFLELALDHHKKTRSLPAYFSMIIDALEQSASGIDPVDPYEAYATVLGGPIFEVSHVEKLKESLQVFVTPGQCLGFLAQTKSTLGHMHSVPSEQRFTRGPESSKQSRKRRKPDLEPSIHSPARAINFAFMCSIVAIVWPSLPLHSLADEPRLEALNEIRGVNTGVITPLLAAGLKRTRDEEGGSTSWLWSRDIITSSALRLQYALTVCTPLNFRPAHGRKVESRMLRLLELPDVLPELKIEIARSLLRSASLGELEDVGTLVERLLACIELFDAFGNESRSGDALQLSRLEEGSRRLSCTLLSFLSHRWLPTLSGAATAEDLRRFVHRLFLPLSGGCSTGDSSGLDVERSTAATSLRSPLFWELPELRDTVLAYLSEKTSHLDVTDFVKTLENLPLPFNLSLDIHQFHAVYTILRYTPMEYLPKSIRIDLTKKAVVFDGQLISTSKPGLVHDNLIDVLSLSREYIGRSLTHAAVFDRPEMNAVTRYFLGSRWCTPTDPETFPSATAERMIGAHLYTVLGSYTPEDELGVLTMIESVQPATVYLRCALQQRLLTLFLETVMGNSQVSKFSAGVRRDFRSLFSSALCATEEHVLGLVSSDTPKEGDIVPFVACLELWCALISFKTWSSDIDAPVPKLAGAVTKKILTLEKPESASLLSTLHNRAALVSLSELSSVSADEAPQASENFLAIYLSLSRVDRAPGVNGSISGFIPFHSLPTHVFETVLTKISEFCLERTTSSTDVIAMVRLSKVLLRNAPQGTMKVTQKHTTSSLHLFLNQSLCCLETSASLEICRFISAVSTERPAALLPCDAMTTWTILSKLLSGSDNHDPSTSTDIFREIIGIASAFIRHRRDLVLPGLPHLGMIMQRLVAMIRTIRPGLGAKQARTVANNFPFWFNVREPLGTPEIKVLSRLLVSLTAKTTARPAGSAQETHKMVSLARPFGKHASHVLVAYVKATNDPFCVVYAPTRRELYPGLFALCDMLSDHDREAMILSALDGGGKATMKALWNDYKKQKYVGQG